MRGYAITPDRYRLRCDTKRGLHEAQAERLTGLGEKMARLIAYLEARIRGEKDGEMRRLLAELLEQARKDVGDLDAALRDANKLSAISDSEEGDSVLIFVPKSRRPKQ